MGVTPTPIDLILQELRRLSCEIAQLREEVSQLREAVRRPERVRYRPQDLAAERLHVSVATVYRLWNSGKLRYSEDGRGRYSTEVQVREYETLYCS